MSSRVFRDLGRGPNANRYWCRYKDEYGKWHNKPTPFDLTERPLAVQFADATQAHYDQLAGRKATPAGQTEGCVYAIALWPEVVPGRIKIGWTSMDISERLRVYRSANPEARVLCWLTDRTMEKVVLDFLPGRVGKSEVFDIPSGECVITAVDALLERHAQVRATYAEA